MNYPAYPTYKESCIAWLGKVPEHWNIKSARFDYVIQLGKMLQPEASSPLDQETLYLKAQHVQWESVKIKELPKMWTSKSDRKKYGVHDGDLLVCEGGDVGRAGIVRNPPEATIVQNALHRVRSRNADLRYLMFVLEHAATQDWFEILCNRSTIAHFTGEKFGALQIPTPPLSEQTIIADFLDRETGRIDTLIEKKRRLIGLLREKRSALISRTVTRGLPAEAAREFGLEPHARFKDSGIEWLGEVPEGWEVKRLRYICKIETGEKDTVDAEVDGVYPFFVRSQTVERINSFSKDCEGVLTAGDGVGVGKVFHYVKGKFDFHQRVYLFSQFHSVAGKYFFLFLKEYFWRVAFDGGAKSTVDSLRRPMIADFPIVVPSQSEQTAIATYLGRETAKIDQLIDKVEEAIERLQEYRTALITAAVTGKIDVRYAAQSDGQYKHAAEEGEVYG